MGGTLEEKSASATKTVEDAGTEEESAPKQIPDMSICQNYFNYEYYFQILSSGKSVDEEGKNCQEEMSRIKEEIMAKVRDLEMAPFYEIVCERLHWDLDQTLLTELKEKNEAEKEKYKEQEADAEKNAGETEVLDALFDRARFFSRVGARDAAYAAWDAIVARPKVSAGKRMDAAMAKARVALFCGDLPGMKAALEKSAELGELGGDWDRLNRLKVYRAFYLVRVRDFAAASALLLEGVATFTCHELGAYEDFVQRAATLGVLHLPRTELKKQVVDGPEVLGVTRDRPLLGALVTSLYDCDYRGFFEALVALAPHFQRDLLLRAHHRHLVRELRLLAYRQFLEAYRSVRLAGMARAFGVSAAWLDPELARFVAAGRLPAKIDKVAGVVETNRPDRKNAQYRALVKRGDALLNRVQRLARAVDV